MRELSRLTLTLLAATAAAAAAASSQLLSATDAAGGRIIGLENCPTSCGGVPVPFPFGISAGCHLPGFDLICDTSRAPPRLLLGNGVLQVVDISVDDATVRVRGPDIRTDVAAPSSPSSSSTSGFQADGTWGGEAWGLAADGPYILSQTRNEFVFSGCQFFVELRFAGMDQVITSCSSVCNSNATAPRLQEQEQDQRCSSSPTSSCRKCSGIGCCQVPIFFARPSYDVRVRTLDLLPRNASGVPAFRVFIAEEGWFDQQPTAMALTEAERMVVPVVLAWAVRFDTLLETNVTRGENIVCSKDQDKIMCHSMHSSCTSLSFRLDEVSGYTCKCWDGYQGNPYLPDGCQDIDECVLPDKCYGICTNLPGNYSCECPRGANGDPYIRNGCIKSHTGLSIGIGVGSGVTLLLLILGSIFLFHKIKLRRENKLRQRFFKQNRGQLLQQLICQRADIAERMIITLKELEKATDNFDEARELAGGGHGAIYKGILSSLQVVAVKKSKIVVQTEIDDFINEVAILSQINHRNIVKLIGCCLETEVPLLVYEFINNGTLYNHLHVEAPISLSWKDRLRIAVETAGALAYLHSYVSTPIIHRDIKSPNILLDENLTVKLSDFGASRHVPVDKKGIDTVVQGTFGYLDPTYYVTGHLTEKSDVYSFGVILIELLTREKPISYRSVQGYGLVKHFVNLLSEDNLIHVLDPQVAREGTGEVTEVALLAKRCVKLVAEERPTMRQVEMTLESIYTAKEFFSSDVTGSDEFEADWSWTWQSSISVGRNNPGIH